VDQQQSMKGLVGSWQCSVLFSSLFRF